MNNKIQVLVGIINQLNENLKMYQDIDKKVRNFLGEVNSNRGSNSDSVQLLTALAIEKCEEQILSETLEDLKKEKLLK